MVTGNKECNEMCKEEGDGMGSRCWVFVKSWDVIVVALIADEKNRKRLWAGERGFKVVNKRVDVNLDCTPTTPQ